MQNMWSLEEVMELVMTECLALWRKNVGRWGNENQ